LGTECLAGDRTRPFHTKLPVNQGYLNQISAPPDVAVLTPVFEELAQLERAGKLPGLRRVQYVPAHAWHCLLFNVDPGDVRTCEQRRLEAEGRRPTPPADAPRLTGHPSLKGGAKATAPTATLDLVARWRRAEADAIFADDRRSARYFLSITRDYPDHFIGQLALLAAAHWQHRVGLDDGPGGAQALFTLLAGCGRGDTPAHASWLQHPAQLGLADLAFSHGRYAEARRRYAALREACRQDAGAPTATAGAQEAGAPAAWCGFRIAQCDEFTGRLAEAVTGYEACAKGENKDLAAEAGYAIKRVGRLTEGPHGRRIASGPLTASSPPAPLPPLAARAPREGSTAVVRYLGEDRATQGDWYRRYGREAFILCAQQSPQDVAGSCGFGTNPPTPWKVTPSVGNPREVVRHWVTSRSDDHRSLLWNPLSQVRRAANWDDRGEAYAVGTGPDLLLDVPVPAGEHVCSLYFVNDRSYYERGRVYTISVWDEQGTYLTGAEVRHFVRGVYYRFGVSGTATPTHLKFRLWRNLAYNLILAGLFLDRPGEPTPWPEQISLWAPHRTTVTLPPASGTRCCQAGPPPRRRETAPPRRRR